MTWEVTNRHPGVTVSPRVIAPRGGYLEWSGWLKELALESDKKELEKMVQEEEQRLEEFMSREMEKSESEKRLLRRIL